MTEWPAESIAFTVASHPSRATAPLQATMPLGSDETPIVSHHNPTSPPDRLIVKTDPSPGLSGLHSRESSATIARGRLADSANLSLPTLQPHSRNRGHSQSKSPEAAIGRPSGTPNHEGSLERKPSISSYGHHRKTSIVHGIQHSRNPSYAASSTSASPLSPEMIASAGLGVIANSSPGLDPTLFSRLDQPESLPSYTGTGSTSTGLTQPSGLSTIEDDDMGDTVKLVGQGTKPAHKKMLSNGSKMRRDPSHSRGHSKHHHQEAKTVGEYALHHLFNSVRTSHCQLILAYS